MSEMNIGTSIKIALKSKGETQVWLAKQLSVSKQYVNALCKCKHAGTPVIEKCAKIFKMTEGEFIDLPSKQIEG